MARCSKEKSIDTQIKFLEKKEQKTEKEKDCSI